MKKIFFLLQLLALLPIAATAQGNGYGLPRYDLASYGIGKEGTYTAKISVYQKKPDKETDRVLRRCAVHGVIFKGLTADDGGQTQRPMVSIEQEKKNADFFNNFFADDALCLRYATVIDGSLRVEKVSKKEYCIHAIVVIKKDDLRHYLEEKHIISSFNDLF